jgi:hypothetical protein
MIEQVQPTALTAREAMIAARARYYAGAGTEAEMNAAADAYIEALRVYRKLSGKKFSIPSRAYILRAI